MGIPIPSRPAGSTITTSVPGVDVRPGNIGRSGRALAQAGTSAFGLGSSLLQREKAMDDQSYAFNASSRAIDDTSRFVAQEQARVDKDLPEGVLPGGKIMVDGNAISFDTHVNSFTEKRFSEIQENAPSNTAKLLVQKKTRNYFEGTRINAETHVREEKQFHFKDGQRQAVRQEAETGSQIGPDPARSQLNQENAEESIREQSAALGMSNREEIALIREVGRGRAQGIISSVDAQNKDTPPEGGFSDMKIYAGITLAGLQGTAEKEPESRRLLPKGFDTYDMTVDEAISSGHLDPTRAEDKKMIDNANKNSKGIIRFPKDPQVSFHDSLEITASTSIFDYLGIKERAQAIKKMRGIIKESDLEDVRETMTMVGEVTVRLRTGGETSPEEINIILGRVQQIKNKTMRTRAMSKVTGALNTNMILREYAKLNPSDQKTFLRNLDAEQKSRDASIKEMEFPGVPEDQIRSMGEQDRLRERQIISTFIAGLDEERKEGAAYVQKYFNMSRNIHSLIFARRGSSARRAIRKQLSKQREMGLPGQIFTPNQRASVAKNLNAAIEKNGETAAATIDRMKQGTGSNFHRALSEVINQGGRNKVDKRIEIAAAMQTFEAKEAYFETMRVGKEVEENFKKQYEGAAHISTRNDAVRLREEIMEDLGPAIDDPKMESAIRESIDMLAKQLMLSPGRDQRSIKQAYADARDTIVKENYDVIRTDTAIILQPKFTAGKQNSVRNTEILSRRLLRTESLSKRNIFIPNSLMERTRKLFKGKKSDKEIRAATFEWLSENAFFKRSDDGHAMQAYYPSDPGNVAIPLRINDGKEFYKFQYDEMTNLPELHDFWKQNRLQRGLEDFFE